MADVTSKRAEILTKFCLEDRIAVVTGGAGGGIGEGIALAFAAVGAHIVIAEKEVGKADITAKNIRSQGVKALPLTVDVTCGDQVQEMVDKVLSEFGRIDILVNNVGGSVGSRAPMLEATDDSWDAVMAVNLKSTFVCSKIVGTLMSKQKSGNIINMASSAGLHPSVQSMAYSTAKAGIVHFTKCASIYLAQYNIRVNCIAPGPIITPATLSAGDSQYRASLSGVPLGRSGYPEDVALSALFLASDASDFITGTCIDIGGGPNLGSVILERAAEVWNSAL